MSIAPTAAESARRQHDKAVRITRYAGLRELRPEGHHTALALHQLPEEKWIVFHDIRLGRGVVDHVVVGPPGVFVVDRRHWAGEITVKKDVVRADGIRRNRALRRSARQAEALVGLVPSLDQALMWPVLTVDTEEQVMGCAREVLVTSTPTIAWALRGCPHVLSVVEVDRVAWEMEAALDGRVVLPPQGTTSGPKLVVPAPVLAVQPRHRAVG